MSLIKIDRYWLRLATLLVAVVSNLSQPSIADPLGTLPEVEAEQVRFIFEGRSDLWLSPYEDKETPVRIYNAKFRFPFIRYENLSAIVSVESEEVSLGRGDLLVGPAAIPLGGSLRAQHIGLGLSYEGDDKSSLSLFGAYASASDEPYGHARDIWPELTATYLSPYYGNWRGIFFGNYSKNRGIMNNQFMPAVGVGYKLKENLEAMLGFPFLRIIWNPHLDWRTLTAITPVGASFEADYSYSDSLLFMTELGISARSYLHASRIDDVHRTIYEEKFLSIGIKRILSPKTYVGFKLGGSFDRYIYESTAVFDSMGNNYSLPGDVTGSFLLEFLP